MEQQVQAGGIEKSEKAVRVLNVITGAAANNLKLLKLLPKSGKINPFIKTYNRRPRNKQKRALVFAQLAMQNAMSAMSIAMILQTPNPKYARDSQK